MAKQTKFMEIIPSIVAPDFTTLESKLGQLKALPRGLIDWVHIDVADGKFAGPKTWPFTADYVDEALREMEGLSLPFKLGVHLMVNRPGEHLDKWLEAPI